MSRKITEAYAGTEAVGATEWSCTTDTSGPDVATTQGQYQFFIDISDMVTGDELQIRVYEKVQASDTQRIIYQSNLVGPQSPQIYVSPILMLMNGWDVTLKAISGTITVTWSIRTPDTDPDVAAIKAKTDQLAFGTANRVNAQVYGMEADTVTASAIADNAIDAGAIAANAITAAKIAADAIGASQVADGAIDAGALAANAITSAKIADGAITSAKIADAALTAAKFAAGAFDAVWSVAARLLTAGTNIVLAKGTGVTGFNDLDAAGVRGAVGLASANLDTQLDAVPSAAETVAEIDSNSTQLAAIAAKTGNLPSDPADQSLIIVATDALATAIAGLTAPDNAGIAAIKAKTDNLPAAPAATGDIPSAAAIAAAVWAVVIDGTRTAAQLARGWTAALLGKASGLDTNAPAFRNIGDTKDVISAVTDADGNRSAVTLDLD